jgi:hypothetical protein
MFSGIETCRAKHPCLHYHIWDLGLKHPEFQIEEEFIFLTEKDEICPLMLNFLAMWCCLMLQTPTRNALLKYLPVEMIAADAGTYLNIGIPLLQAPYSVMVDREDTIVYHSSDLIVQQYYTSWRRRFYELKFSPHPALREFYDQIIHDRIRTRVENNWLGLAEICYGVDKLVKVKPNGNDSGHQWFHVSHHSMTISRQWVRLEHDGPIQVRFHLMTEAELETHGISTHVYCRKAEKFDPAARLAVFIEGTTIEGNPFAGWIQSDATLQVFKVNTLVDVLDSGTMTKSRHLPRRWVKLRYHTRDQGLTRQATYTSEADVNSVI